MNISNELTAIEYAEASVLAPFGDDWQSIGSAVDACIEKRIAFFEKHGLFLEAEKWRALLRRKTAEPMQ